MTDKLKDVIGPEFFYGKYETKSTYQNSECGVMCVHILYELLKKK